MKDFTQKIEFYIDQYDLDKTIFNLGKIVAKRGWLKKDEFLAICLWKSRRPKKLFILNSEDKIVQKSKLSFLERDELKKLRYLTELHGVGIATASAILSIVNPKLYPIIDERCIQSLHNLGMINWTNISEHNWLKYLEIIRNMSEKYKRDARDIEKGLFAFNRINLDKEYKNLYSAKNH
jgi:hypothetical protein